MIKASFYESSQIDTIGFTTSIKMVILSSWPFMYLLYEVFTSYFSYVGVVTIKDIYKLNEEVFIDASPFSLSILSGVFSTIGCSTTRMAIMVLGGEESGCVVGGLFFCLNG